MKLSGLRVVDLSSFLPGPYLTMTLADHGAEVIKVEAPGEGDPGRHIGLSDGPSTVFFRNFNRGKKSVVLDLKSAEGREVLLALCETADVLVETFRPGVADRLGIGPGAVQGKNPRIVYCSISAFGQSGPYRSRPAHDLALEAMSGALSLTLGANDKPAMPAVPVADQLSALQGLSAVLMALLRREATGRGDVIDIAMHDAMLAACANIVGPTFAEGRQPVAKHERTTGGAAFYQVYETRDGRHIVLAGQEKKFVENLLRALDRPDLVPPCLQGPGPHQRPVVAFLQGVFKEKTLAEASAWLSGLDVCFGPVNTLPEAFEDANVAARSTILKDEKGRRHLAPVIRFDDEPASPVLEEPALGAHTEEILGPLRQRKARAARASAQGRSRTPSIWVETHMVASAKPVGDKRWRESFGRYFEDFAVGDVYEHRPGRTISEADNTWFTLLTMNQHPLHFDAAYAAKSEFGRPLVNSCLTLSIVAGMSVSDVSQKAIGNLGWTDIKLTAPVFIGDTVYAESEVLAKRESVKRPTQGIVTVRTTGKKADGTVFMTFERSVLVPKRGHGVDDVAGY